MIRLEGHVVVVTGAGSGLGTSCARLLGARGATVVAAGDTAEAGTPDLATRAGCEALVAAVLDRHHRVDALVHGGGDGVEALWWLCRAVWPGMADRSYGRIVLTVPTAHGIGRAAQLGLLQGLAGEGASRGVLVNAVSPGGLNPDDVAPRVVALVSPACPVTGAVLTGTGAATTPEAVLALLASPAAHGRTAADDAPLETERHRFWGRLQQERDT